MKYAVNTLLWTAAFDKSHLDLLPRIREGGFDGVEVARFAFDGFPAVAVRRAAEAAALEVIICSALTDGMSLIRRETHDQALEFLRTGIRAAADSGAKLLVGPFCSPVGYLPGRRRTPDEWTLAVDGLRALGPLLDDAGVSLALEPLNRFETSFLNTAADAAALCDAVGNPRIGVLFDTFHANIEEKSLGSALTSLGSHLLHVHTCENDRGIPGSGHIEWDELFKTLAELHYNQWLTIESFGSAIPEIAAAACIWRDLAPSPEAIAFEGVQFLKTAAHETTVRRQSV